MEKKCAICHILLNVPCPVAGCSGHHNESVGDVCAYCAANEREEVLLLPDYAPSILSSLEGFELDLDGEVYP